MSEHSLKEQERHAQDHVAGYYEDVRYARPWSLAYHDWLFKHMLKLLRPHGAILDAGCGTGWLATYVPHEKIWGIDISPEMIARAKERLHDARVGDVEELPYENDFFDTIFARAIIHHLEDPEKGVRELTRVLKPGGRVIFMDTRETIFSRAPRKSLLGGEHFSHIHKNMKEREYLAMLRRHLIIERVDYIGYLAYTVLGFPDIMNIYRFMPFKRAVTPVLILLDRIWAKIPIINKMALGMLVVARKK